jgi:hypothetical protein
VGLSPIVANKQRRVSLAMGKSPLVAR